MAPAVQTLNQKQRAKKTPAFDKTKNKSCFDNARPWSVFPLLKDSSSHPPYSMVSLFSGCGGLDLGLKYAGFRTLWANDYEPDACATYRTNLGEIVEGDILNIGFPENIDEPDLLTAGFPCQSFSNAGSRRGVKDLGGRLYLTALKAVEHFNPKTIIFENVRGLLSSKNGDTLIVQHICERLSELGYNTYFKLLDASRHHVPQRRLRLFIVGIKNSIRRSEFVFPLEISNDTGLSLRETVFDIPADTPNQKELLALNPQAIEIGSLVPEGGSWKSIPYEALPERLKRIKDNIARYRWPNFYRRFARDEIAGTVTAAFKPENAGVWHPTKNRVFSVREIARIQSFPDWFLFTGKSIKSKYQQIGNAVPPRLAYEVGLQIRSLLEGKSPMGGSTYISFEAFLKLGRPFRPSDKGVYLNAK